VLLRGVVLAERRLDPALRLGRVARLERALGGERDPSSRALGGDRGRKTGGAAPDDEHVELHGPGHDTDDSTSLGLIPGISDRYPGRAYAMDVGNSKEPHGDGESSVTRDNPACHPALIPQTGWLPSCGFATIVAEMVERQPNSPFEKLLGSLTDEDLDRQERVYEEDIQRLGVLLEAVRATKAARRMMNGSDGLAEATKRPSTMYEAVLTVMATQPEAAWTAEQILVVLKQRGWTPGGQTPKNTVDATLSRLTTSRDVRRVRRGHYQLASAADVASNLMGDDIHF
jgi:hypothetical protein